MEVFLDERRTLEFPGKDTLTASVKVSVSDEYIVVDCSSECGHWIWEEEYEHNEDWELPDVLNVKHNVFNRPSLMRFAINSADLWFKAVDNHRFKILNKPAE